MIKNLTKNPIVRKIITFTAIGITLYFAWIQYKKYTNKIKILENALQVMKQQVKIKNREIQLIQITHRKKYEMMQNVGENTLTNITENIQPIVTNNYDNFSHERIYKELPINFENYNNIVNTNIEDELENSNKVNIDYEYIEDEEIDSEEIDSDELDDISNLDEKDDLFETDINLEQEDNTLLIVRNINGSYIMMDNL